MKTINMVGFILFFSLFMGSCLKDDIDDLRSEQSKQSDRIEALEAWSKTINSNIEALQSLTAALEAKDYVTGVTPVKQGSEEIGYTISFSKSAPITIYHGKMGDTPMIGVKQDTDKKYYWTQTTGSVTDQWILDTEGKKIPAEATVPQIRINTSSNLWEISSDGGKTWTSTGVKATGDKGDTGTTGSNGSSIFSSIDQTNADYVTFNLTGGGSIQLPKYKAFSVTLTDDAGEFFIGQVKKIDYSLTGLAGNPSVTLKAMNVPQGWKTAINTTDNTITVTAPVKFNDFNRAGEITFQFTDGIERTALKVVTINARKYRLGDYFPDPDVAFNPAGIPTSGTMPLGVVFYLNNPEDEKSTSGKIVSLEEAQYSWCSSDIDSIYTTDLFDGRKNMYVIQDAVFIDHLTTKKELSERFPAFNWIITELNNQKYDYNSDRDFWYFPALNELKELCIGYCGLDYDTFIEETGWLKRYSSMPNYNQYDDQRAAFNLKLTNAGGVSISDNYYQSSFTEWINTNKVKFTIWCLKLNNGTMVKNNPTSEEFKLRAIAIF